MTGREVLEAMHAAGLEPSGHPPASWGLRHAESHWVIQRALMRGEALARWFLEARDRGWPLCPEQLVSLAAGYGWGLRWEDQDDGWRAWWADGPDDVQPWPSGLPWALARPTRWLRERGLFEQPVENVAFEVPLIATRRGWSQLY